MKGGALLDPKPLVDWLDAHPDATEGWHGKKKNGDSVSAALHTLNAMRRGRRVTFVRADELCCLLGVHMSKIYGPVYWTARVDDRDDGIDDLDPDYEMDAAA